MVYWILGIVAVIYSFICCFFYFFQEKLIFYPQKLPDNYQFTFKQPFQEQTIQTTDGKKLHGILFKADSARGLVFYLHGNAGALNSWGEIAGTYTDLQYDIFILDYRGFGKSEGEIIDQEQFYSDAQQAYNQITLLYKESDIVITGFSIGSAVAAMLASKNHPRMLILQAPYYSLIDLMQQISPVVYAILPDFLFKYKFKTHEFIQNTKVPIIIFHGDKDRVIYPGSSVKLKKHLKPTDRLIILRGQDHNGINENVDYVLSLRELLLHY